MRLPPGLAGQEAETSEAFNDVATLNERTSRELRRVSRIVGRHGQMAARASIPGAVGGWARNVEAINGLIEQLTEPAIQVSRVLGAVAGGDLSQRMAIDIRGRPLRGEFLHWAELVNTMVDQLNAFAAEVTRVAREVGTEGKLGGQADVRGVGGTWKDLTDSVNSMADNLTAQVRAIGDVATAVTRGDLSRSVQVSASGEVEILKDDINEMIQRLRDTTRQNSEQVWLKTNLARFSGLLQGQRDPETVGRLILSELAPLIGVLSGVIYLRSDDGDTPILRLLATYARRQAPPPPPRANFGEGLIGQCASERRRIILRDLPSDYIAISSALGSAPPRMIAVLPVMFEGEIQAVVELATFDPFTEVQLAFLDELSGSVGIVLSTIAANSQAEAYLREQAARAEAEAGLARLRQVVDAMPEGILIADAAGSVYLHNAAAVEIMGKVPTSVLSDASGMPEVRRRDGSRCPPREQPLARAILHQEVVRGEQLIVINTASGREVPILVNSVPLSDASDEGAGGVAVFQDITPLHEVERQRDEFLAAVSHDLRNPVAIIKGRADLLRRGLDKSASPDFEKLANGLRAIDTSTVRLVRMVDELLDLTRLRMGDPIELNVASTDLAEITRRTADEYQETHPDRAIALSLDGDRLLGQWDGTRIERVVANLLSNAVKYGAPDSEIRIGAFREVLNGQPGVVLTVENLGAGIPSAELDRVFDTYYRGTNVPSTIGGTGVGLAGARQIVEQHGGAITVDSIEGETTTFTVRLPVVPPS